jgi:hypothetical protein
MFRNFLPAAVLMAFYGLAFSNPSGINFSAEGRRILAPDHASYLLDQCTRNTPKAVVSYWLPSSADIDNLERRLPVYLSKSAKPLDGEYTGTYIGIVTKGRKLIYGNFSPRLGPEMVCDGGRQFWGIVFDPSNNSFSDLEFNGEG